MSNVPPPILASASTRTSGDVDARERLIVALDVPSLDEARQLVRQLEGSVQFYKIGPWLQLLPGVNDFIRELIETGHKVFLDYKHFDVEETVRRAVENACDRGISFLTIHGTGRLINAAVDAKLGRDLKLLAVTVLTSFDHQDIVDMGYRCNLEELVLFRAERALVAGCDGIVASGREARSIRETAGSKLLIVTPGIRPGNTSTDDHARPSSPGAAIRAGADYLVVGRPIVRAKDPVTSAAEILEEMREAFTA